MKTGHLCLLTACLATAALAPTSLAAGDGKAFNRVATFPVYLNTSVDDTAIAEIVAASRDGKTLVYTDSVGRRIGFVDITNPSNPQPAGIVPVGGSPTSVVVHKGYALVCVDTSPSFTEPSGVMLAIDMKTLQVLRSFDLGGQPDCIAVNHNGKYAVITIENQRDEELGDGAPPQEPPGFVAIVELKGKPSQWSIRNVDLVGIPDLYPTDPEPEFVDINQLDIAAVTLQENNHVVMIDIRSAEVVGDFSAGTASPFQVDVAEDDLITQDGSLSDVLREPDGITWLSSRLFATANEGDLIGGTRGFTIFDSLGDVAFDSGNVVEHLLARVGHYPEGRSENKGGEPEGVKFAKFGSRKYLFVGLERASVVAVYRLDKHGDESVDPEGSVQPEDDIHPRLVQVLPAGLGPEGLLTIPKRGLLVSAGENDSRGDGFRGVLTIYELQKDRATYPTVHSANRADGTPIPWAALSALAADPSNSSVAYTAHDSFYRKARLYELDLDQQPAEIVFEIVLRDANDLIPERVDDPLDHSVNLDIEGVSLAANDGFWIASEGAATAAALANYLLKVASDGEIEQVVRLPESLEAHQVSSGFEGVSAVSAGNSSEFVYVAIQREWKDDPLGFVKIGRYDTELNEWKFFHYPLDPVESPNGGVVGLSEIVAINDETFAVIERDNQAGTDARIKRIYSFSVAGIEPALHGNPLPVLTKTFVKNLLPDLNATNGAVLEKVEGLALLGGGDALVVTDNDGVDDHTGETQLLRIERLFDD